MEKVRKELRDVDPCGICRFKEIRTIDEPCGSCVRTEKYIGFEFPEELEAELKAAEEALEKQTAKKVIPKEKIYDESYDWMWTGERCLVCENDDLISKNNGSKANYCPCCGQKLDWSV